MLPFHTLVKAEWKKFIDDAIAQEEGDLRFIKWNRLRESSAVPLKLEN